jgi:cell volume regulation protein A
MAVIAAYVGADGLHSSGFMAVFVFGIVFGNQDSLGFKLSTNEEIEFNDFIATNSLIMRMFIFIILGSQVDFKLINLYFISGMCVVLFLIFIARPITVLVCALPDSKAKWHRNELIFMSCKRETGVIPGALAAMLIGINAPHANLIAAVTFLAIFTTISVQATSTKWLATKLKLLIE